jgi:hypothetical protein
MTTEKEKVEVELRKEFSGARRHLVNAVLILEKHGCNFEKTVKEIKETIGDLEVASSTLMVLR